MIFFSLHNSIINLLLKSVKLKLILAILISWLCCFSSFAGVDFDGTDDYIDLAGDANQRTTNFTVALWYRPDAVSADKKSLYTNGVASGGVGLNADQACSGSASAGEVCGWLYNGSAWKNTGQATDVLTAGTWIHLAITWTNNGTFLLYVNGAQANSTALATSTVSYGTSVASIGRDATDGNYTNGVIDDVYFWSVQLTAAEIALLYNSRVKGFGRQLQPASLVDYWGLDDQPDGTSFDGDTAFDHMDGTDNGTGVDGANNTGLASSATVLLTYP